MSIETNLHIGPVIKCEGPTQFTTHEGTRCPNKKCIDHERRFVNGDFCQVCGSKIETYDIPSPMSHFDILDSEGVDENMFHVINSDLHEVGKDVDVFTDNQRSEHTKSFDAREGGSMVFTDDTVLHALDHFATKFAKEITILHKYYKSVVVDYMVFIYYN